MSSLNLNPVTKPDRPTTHLTVNARKVGSSDVVEVQHNNRSAYFYVDAKNEYIASKLQNDVLLHDNVTGLFGGLDRGAPFIVRTDASLSDVRVCEKAELHAKGVDEERLANHLKGERMLLHPGVEERIDVDGTLVDVQVVSLEPANYSTVVVTDSTTLEFVDENEAARAKAPPADGADGEDGGQRGADDEDDVDIDVSPEVPTVSFEEDVAGLDDVKETAQMLLALFDPDTRAEVVDHYGEKFASRGGSMLLYGPPGCGKTLVSEAIAYEAANNTDIEDEYGDVQFIPVKGGDILSRYPGEAERRVEAVFDQAHQIAQDGFAVLFFDEIETLIPDRGDDDLQRHERSLTNAFLQEMGTDKIEDNLLIVGATNMPFTIDPAASRRFPVQQFIPQPDEAVMSEVWRKELTSLEAAGNGGQIDYESLAAESNGYTPAEIADRVLGTELQRDLVRSVVEEDRDPVEPNTEYLLSRLEMNEPKTVRQYVTSVRGDLDSLEGYPEMRRYIEDQADALGISVGNGGLLDELTGGSSGDLPEE